MGLVHHQQRDRRRGERGTEARRVEALGRHVEQRDRPRACPLERGPLPLLGHVGVERGRRDSGALQASELVGHQRDQRGHDHCEPGQHGRGRLVAERLAGAGGHDHQRVAAREPGRDRAVLAGAQAPHAEEREGGLERLSRGCRPGLAGHGAAGDQVGDQLAQQPPFAGLEVRPGGAQRGQGPLDGRGGRRRLRPRVGRRLDPAGELGQRAQREPRPAITAYGVSISAGAVPTPPSLAAPADAPGRPRRRSMRSRPRSRPGRRP